MYLSRLILNPRDRAVWRDLADCQALHRTVMAAFPQVPDQEYPRAAFAVLYRLEINPRTGASTLLVQSREEPDWSHLPAGYLLETGIDPRNPEWKRVDDGYAGISAGARLQFRLRANPTRKIDTKSGPDGARRNGRRVELRGEEPQLAWLERKAKDGGFRLVSVRAKPEVANVRTMPGARVTGDRGRTGKLTFAPVLFEGELLVEDGARFQETLRVGIGSAKAYGFGLLSVAPARE